MSAVSTSKSVQPSAQTSPQTIQAVAVAKAVETVSAIARDTVERMATYKSSVKVLASGVFYGNEYYKALKQTKNEARLQHLLKKGSFYHGFAPTTHFTMLPKTGVPTGVQAACFVVKAGVTASAALQKIREGLSFLGCGETCQIGYFEAVKEVLGTEKFDFLFAPDSPSPLRVHFDSFDNPMNCLVKKTIGSPKSFSRGQVICIQNNIQYNSKHINGEATGFISMCCDDTKGREKFTTLGLKAEGMTVEEISEVLRSEYNSDPIGMAALTEEVAQKILKDYAPEELEIVGLLKSHQLTKAQFQSRGGGRIPISFELRIDRLEQLAKATNQEARALFNEWMRELPRVSSSGQVTVATTAAAATTAAK